MFHALQPYRDAVERFALALIVTFILAEQYPHFSLPRSGDVAHNSITQSICKDS